MQAIFPLLAFLVGVVVPLQAAVNNQLRLLLGNSTLLAALVSFGTGCLTLALLSLATGQRWQNLAALARVEWWMLLGGCWARVSCLAPPCWRRGWAWRPWFR
ncbi:Uncharacterized protein conserved in bacteria [Chromobacterium violaceum]|uniref:Uncharacterized protein conserved in bacteria n=1 Tax=Chromobacterium violaceum TaxID=536 RepID=A0A447T537_CHRVL|nr:Uncharacterized protein conserved in bacteria [Chromobacterium violaceum]